MPGVAVSNVGSRRAAVRVISGCVPAAANRRRYGSLVMLALQATNGLVEIGERGVLVLAFQHNAIERVEEGLADFVPLRRDRHPLGTFHLVALRLPPPLPPPSPGPHPPPR